MPLEHSKSKEALGRNIGRELAAGKPRKQAIAIAYATKRAATGDEDETVVDHGVHTTEYISKRRSRTPEGYLLCEEVPVARTGEMLYLPGEVPVEPGPDGYVHVHRDSEDLFGEETLRTLTGKSVTDEHPPVGQLVTPEVWVKLSKGVVLNPRAGVTEDGEAVIFCDLLITDKETIEKVEAGKVEVSAGYEADYEDLGGGQGLQTDFIFNHVALVDKGRCGPRCAIGDHDSVTRKESTNMPTQAQPRAGKARTSFFDKFRRFINDAEAEFGGTNPVAMGSGDTRAVGVDEEDGPLKSDSLAGADAADGTHVHVHLHGSADDHSLMNQMGAPTADEDATGMAPGEDLQAPTLESLAEELTTVKQLLVKLIAMQQADIDADEQAHEDMVQGASGGVEQEGDTESGSTDEAPEGSETMDQSPEGVEDTPGGKEGAGTETDGPRDSDALAGADDSRRSAKVMTGDSAAFATDWKRLIADANILVPGFRVPTFDAKAKRSVTIDTMCMTRRSALAAAYATADGASLVHAVSGSDDLNISKLSCADVKSVFTAAVGAKKLSNNRAATQDARSLPRALGIQNEQDSVAVGGIKTPEQLNKFYADYYGPKAK